jgi:hypothetical protein
MAGFDIWALSHSTFFTSWILSKYLTDGEDCLPSFYVHGSKRSTLWLSITAARCTDDYLFGTVKEKTMSEAFWERIHYAFKCTFEHEWMALVKDESRQTNMVAVAGSEQTRRP